MKKAIVIYDTKFGNTEKIEIRNGENDFTKLS